MPEKNYLSVDEVAHAILQPIGSSVEQNHFFCSLIL